MIGIFTLAMGIILSSIPWVDYLILKVSKNHKYSTISFKMVLKIMFTPGLNQLIADIQKVI